MLSFVLAWVVISLGFVGGFLDLDELKNVYYGIDISNTPLLHPSELPSDAVILSSKYGQLYQCTYPPVPSQASTKENEAQAKNVSVAELLSPMKQLPCLFTNKGWWTYEFCYGREIKQYHTEDGKIVGDVIVLGEYDVRNDIVNDSQKADDSRQKSVERYHHHFYVNGTMCDLTGRMREAEVRFVCQEGHGDFVLSIDERETCSYIVTVHTSRICTHPLFGPPVTIKSLPISCNPLLSASDYEIYMKEYPAGIVSKDGTDADNGQPDVKVESTSVVKKLLIESMLKSVQAMLKQQQENQQPHIDGTDITSEVTSPDLQTDDVTLPPASDGSAVDEPVDEASEADSDASLSFADKDVVDNSASTSHTESDRSDDEADAEAGSTDRREDGDDDSRVDDDEDDDENEHYVKEFENEMKDIASTSALKTRLAKYKDTIASAMQAQFSNILQEAQADMARDGEEVAPVDKDVAFKNLAKTLNLLLQRLEKMKTDSAGEKADDGSSVGDDAETQSSVDDATDERESTATAGDDGQEQSSDDTGDIIVYKQRVEQVSSDSKTQEASDEVASKGEDGVDETVDKKVPASRETIRDRLEKAGIRTDGERKLDLKIISAGSTDYTSVQLFSDEDGSPTGRVFIAIIGDDEDAVKEKERNERFEENYRFKWNRNENDER